MISIEPNIGELKNEYKVTLDSSLSMVYKGKVKVKFNHIPLDKPEDGFDSPCNWEIFLNPGEWAFWKSGGSTRCDINIYTEEGKHILSRVWSSLLDGDNIEKAFNIFCKVTPNCKGVVIGTHDGSWGHWVDAVRNTDTKCLLIEGSEKQFLELTKNYEKYDNCTLLNHIATKDGKDVTWYKTSMGLSDSLYSEVCQGLDNNLEIESITKPTKDINKIIEQHNFIDYDFLHLDVEGYDDTIIKNIKYLPKLIVFENQHIKERGDYDELVEFLKKNNYDLIEEGIDTMATKIT